MVVQVLTLLSPLLYLILNLHCFINDHVRVPLLSPDLSEPINRISSVAVEETLNVLARVW